MIRNVMKRTLSVLLVLTLVFTTFVIFDPSVFFPTAEAATSTKNQEPYSPLFFNVPEAIYLKPVYNSYSAETTGTFQWYVNNTVNVRTGELTPNTGEEGTGIVQFYYANATDVKLKFKWQTEPGSDYGTTSNKITLGGTARSQNTDFNMAQVEDGVHRRGSYQANITAGTAIPYAANVTGRYICWIATYTDRMDNKTKQAYAYTYVYKPYTTPVGVSLRGKCTRGGNSFAAATMWLSGFHSITSAGSYYAKSESGTSNYGLMPFSSSDTSGTSVGSLYAQIADRWGYATGGNHNSSGWISSSAQTGMAAKGFNHKEGNHGYNSGDETQLAYTFPVRPQ